MSLVLSSYKGHSTVLGNGAGTTQFTLDLDGTHTASYIFTLRAVDADSSTSKFATLDYVEARDPIVDYFTNDHEHTSIYWEAEGADHVNILYRKDGFGDTEIVFTKDQGLDPVDGFIDIPIREPLFAEQGGRLLHRLCGIPQPVRFDHKELLGLCEKKPNTVVPTPPPGDTAGSPL
jgi:hypothetical protein